MAFANADLQSAIAKLATSFTNAELEAVACYLGDSDDEVAGFGGDPARDRRTQGYLLQRIEAHPGFKPMRLGFTATGDLGNGNVNMDEGETI